MFPQKNKNARDSKNRPSPVTRRWRRDRILSREEGMRAFYAEVNRLRGEAIIKTVDKAGELDNSDSKLGGKPTGHIWMRGCNIMGCVTSLLGGPQVPT